MRGHCENLRPSEDEEQGKVDGLRSCRALLEKLALSELSNFYSNRSALTKQLLGGAWLCLDSGAHDCSETHKNQIRSIQNRNHNQEYRGMFKERSQWTTEFCRRRNDPLYIEMYNHWSGIQKLKGVTGNQKPYSLTIPNCSVTDPIVLDALIRVDTRLLN